MLSFFVVTLYESGIYFSDQMPGSSRVLKLHKGNPLFAKNKDQQLANNTVQTAVMFWTCIWDMLTLNLCQETCYPDQQSSKVPSDPQANAGIAFQLGHK